MDRATKNQNCPCTLNNIQFDSDIWLSKSDHAQFLILGIYTINPTEEDICKWGHLDETMCTYRYTCFCSVQQRYEALTNIREKLWSFLPRWNSFVQYLIARISIILFIFLLKDQGKSPCQYYCVLWNNHKIDFYFTWLQFLGRWHLPLLQASWSQQL